MLINTLYVYGGSNILSFVTGLCDCDGIICTPYLVSMNMEIVDIIDGSV